MILADTTVWIDHLRGTDAPHVMRLRTAIEEREALIGDLILMEILQGVRDDSAVERIQGSLRGIPVRRLARTPIPLKAAANYRALRKLGFTPRNSTDTLIATYCIEYDLDLLHNDRDFDPFERHLGLKIVQVVV